MAVEDILRFEGLGLKLGGGKSMACKRRKRVFSTALGREVLRCAEFEKDGVFGAFAIPGVDFGQIKDTLITGGVAVGGAIATGKIVAYGAPLVRLDTTSRWMPVLEIITGLGLGAVVGKLTKKPELGAAFAIGPVVLVGVRLVADILATNKTGLSGRPPVNTREQLGVIQDQAAFPPEFMFDRESVTAGFPQEGAWSMG